MELVGEDLLFERQQIWIRRATEGRSLLERQIRMSKDTGATEAVRKQRDVQEEVDRADRVHGIKRNADAAMQAGARTYPAPPFPPQHTKRNPAMRPLSIPRRCTTPPSIAAPRSSKEKSR